MLMESALLDLLCHRNCNRGFKYPFICIFQSFFSSLIYYNKVFLHAFLLNRTEFYKNVQTSEARYGNTVDYIRDFYEVMMRLMKAKSESTITS